jgi:hypothetical protein
MTDLPADVRQHLQETRAAAEMATGKESAFLETVKWFREIDEGTAWRGSYKGADEDAETSWL